MTKDRTEYEKNKGRNAYIIIGPPTSGKTSMAIDVEKKIDAQRIIGRNISETIDLDKTSQLETERRLMPDELFIPALKSLLSNNQSEKFVFDNIPRTRDQANVILDWANKKGFNLHLIILELTEDDVVERAAQRSVCLECGSSYHPKLKPSKTDGVCDLDGHILIPRKGDKEEPLRHGYQSYQSLKEDILSVLGSQAKIYNIPATGTTFETAKKIFEGLGIS